MLEFIQTYGVQILTGIIAVAGAIISTNSTIRMFKIEKKVKITQSQNVEDIKITREGIVEAFKKSKIAPDWKISIDKQIDQKLKGWAQQFLIMFKEHESMRTKLAAANTKILAYTAAFNKLSKEEQNEIATLVVEAEGSDNVIEV